MAKEPHLNSLERFRKQPGRLVLEEHGHCEVPAGCGGVVLRWRNPHAPLLITIHLYTPVPAQSFVDGNELESARIILAPGPHTVAVVLENVDPTAVRIMFSASHNPREYQKTLPAELIEPSFLAVSADDGTWKFSLEPPEGQDWLSTTFDDRDWPALVKTATPELQWQDHGSYQWDRCRQLGAVCLRVPAPSSTAEPPSWWRRILGKTSTLANPHRSNVWIRKVFEVPSAQVHGAGA
jgi:hypothetical protein